jgi:cytochrome c biogenesis protein CcdA
MKAPVRPEPVAAIALPRWQRWAIYIAVALLVVSGLGWLLTAWPSDAPPSPAARTAAAWFLRAHGIAAYALLIAAGSVLPMHVRLGWGRHHNRRSGSVLIGLMLGLAGTGLWLYYGPEAGRDTVSTLHWAVGLGLPVWLLLHRLWGLRARRG